MSDKIREFLEVPQQFVRDGNQVRAVPITVDSSDHFALPSL